MTRTTRALKRLGVASIAVATIGAGVPAFFATAASASHVTTVTLTPKAVISATNSCTPFTVRVSPTQATVVDVQISQATTNAGTTPVGTPAGVQFCGATSDQGPNPKAAPTSTTSTAPSGIGAGTINPVGNNGVFTNPGPACTNTAPGQGGQSVSGSTTTSTCNAEFTTDASGQATFGVLSTSVGTVSIIAYVEEANTAANGNAAPNETGNNVPNIGEPQDSAQLFVVSDIQSAVTKISCTPRTSFGQTGNTARFVCTAFGDNPTTAVVGATPVFGTQLRYVVPTGPDANQTPTLCNRSANTDPSLPGVGSTSNQNGQSLCAVQNQGRPGTDDVIVYAESNGQAGVQANEIRDNVTAKFSGAPRNIACTPKTATNPVGTEHQITCHVTDVLGQPVASNAGGNNTNSDTFVRFLLGGVGRIVSNNCTSGIFGGGLNSTGNVCYVATDLNGDARLFIRSDQNGSSTVQADITDPNTNTGNASDNPNAECNQPAGATRSGVNATTAVAGNCTDKVTKAWGTGVNPTTPPSPGASPTGTASPAPTGTASPAPTGTASPASPVPNSPLTLTVLDPLIPAGSTARLVASGTANKQYQLQCYTRPSTTYFTARSGSFDAAASPVTFTLALGRNTRCYIQYANTSAGASPTVVINVRTVLSLSTVCTGVRTYIFQGRNLPRAAGQLITLYRVDGAGNEIRTINLITDASGIYRVTRTFTANGTFQFKVRTTQTLDNAAGVSNTITVRVF